MPKNIFKITGIEKMESSEQKRPDQRKNSEDRFLDFLRQEIKNSEKDYSHLSTTEMALSLGVSRRTIQFCKQSLKRTGYIKIYSNTGFRLADKIYLTEKARKTFNVRSFRDKVSQLKEEQAGKSRHINTLVNMNLDYRKTGPVQSRYGINSVLFPGEDFKKMSKERASAIIETAFWNKIKASHMPEHMKLIYLDCAVMQGAETAVKCAQHVLGIKADGIPGEKTIEAFKNRVSKIRFFKFEFVERRLYFLIKGKSFKHTGEDNIKHIFEIARL